MTPALSVEGYKTLLSEDEYKLLLDEIPVPLIPSIRFNPLKTEIGFSSTLEARYGWSLEPLPFCSTGFRVHTQSGPAVSSTLEHKLGMYYVQEAASMLPVELFSIDNTADEISLDLAASPGGKTTHLVSRLHDRGLVIANDSSQGRIQALRIVLQNWGASSCAITRFPGESFGSWYPDTFDRVLLDAPCSMQGLRTSESHPVRPVTEKESNQLSLRQAALLTSALQSVRVGGEVVYSTCTLLPKEDEGVVDAILKNFDGRVTLLNAQMKLPTPAPGLTGYNGQEFAPEMENTIRLWPHRYHTAGFFACILQKTDTIELPTSTPPTHSMEKAGFLPLSDSETSQFCEKFVNEYGYNLLEFLVGNARGLVRRDERVFIFPTQFLQRFSAMPVQSVGILLGENTPDGFLPSHEWVSRFGR